MAKLSNLHETLLQQSRTNQHKSSADPSSVHAISCSGPLADARNFETLRHLRFASPIPHPCALAPQPPRHTAPVTLPPTHHIWFSFHGPRPVSHLTPPGTRHSRPARPRGRTCLVTNTPLSAVHPPRCSGLTKSEWPGVPAHSLRDHGPRASRPASHDPTALVPYDPTALAPLTLGPATRFRPPRGPCAPSCQLWTCQTRAPKSQAHGVRRDTGRDCRGCLRPYATWSSQHLTVGAIPRSGQHLTVCAISSPSRHPTRRASAGGEGPPQTTPLLSVRGCERGSNPLSSNTLHTPHTSGRGRKFD
jgi:hypothetical protein